MHKVGVILNDDYRLLTSEESINNKFKGIYATDLLSSAIKHIKDKVALVTIISTQTAISLSVMLDLEVVIIPADQSMEDIVIRRANQEGIAVISTSLKAHEVIIDFYKRGFL